MDRFQQLADKLDDFVLHRDWARFHSPRNLALALGGEVGELQAELQWVTEATSSADYDDALRHRLESEAADVLIYLMLFCKSSGFDLLDAANSKLEVNEGRFASTETHNVE